MLKQFEQMQKMVKQLSGGNMNKKFKRKGLGGMMGGPGMGSKGGFPF